MYNSKLDKFLVKRAVAFSFLLAAVDLTLLGNNRWLVLAGLFTGTVVSIGRLGGNEWIFTQTFKSGGRKAAAGSIAAFTISQLVLLPAIALSYYLSKWALYGFIAGILAIPVIVMINSITEAFGITKNNFEQGGD